MIRSIFYSIFLFSLFSLHFLQCRNVSKNNLAKTLVSLVKEEKESFLEKFWSKLDIKRSNEAILSESELFLIQVWNELFNSGKITCDQKESALIFTVKHLKDSLEKQEIFTSKKELCLNKQELDRIFDLNNKLLKLQPSFVQTVVKSFESSISVYNKNLKDLQNASQNKINEIKPIFTFLESEAQKLQNVESCRSSSDKEKKIYGNLDSETQKSIAENVEIVFNNAEKINPENALQLSNLTTDFLNQIKLAYKGTRTIFGGSISSFLENVEKNLINKVSSVKPSSLIISFLNDLSQTRKDSSKKTDKEIENAFNFLVNKHVGSIELKTKFISELLECVNK